MEHKIIATLACRNNSARLYAKPLQRLQDHSVLQFMINCIRETPGIHGIVLAISEQKENEMYGGVAKQNNVSFVMGSDKDVLGRLISACELGGGDIVFRVTTESPFTYLEGLEAAVKSHIETKADYTTYAKLPDGVTFELINLSALKISHKEGEDRHRSELCTLYINENKNRFNINILNIEPEWQRPDYRLTIDYPEDLILCRRIVENLGGDGSYIPYKKIITFLDTHPEISSIVENIELKNYIKPYH